MNLMVSVLISRMEFMRIAKENYKPNGDKKKEFSPMSTPGVYTERQLKPLRTELPETNGAFLSGGVVIPVNCSR